MQYLYIKALHVIFIVTWFSGLFYIVRLFVYFAETEEKTEPERSILQNQFKIMQKRLWYGITWPSAILTLIFGPWVWYLYGSFPDWLFFKLVFVAALYGYQLYCHTIFSQQQKGYQPLSSTALRIWNEAATVFLVAIVFLVILKNTMSFVYGLAGLLIFTMILLLAIRIYKKSREK